MDRTYGSRRRVQNKPKENHKSKVMIIGNIDYVVLLCVIILVLIGVIMVFSSSYYDEARSLINDPNSGADIFSYLKKQGAFAIIGFIGMLFMSNFNYKYLKRYSFLMYLLANVLLVLVLLVGDSSGGAKRWITILGFRFQPSEFAKMAVILFVSFCLDKHKDALKRWGGYLFIGFIILVPVVLIAVENVSTAIILILIGFGIMFVASPHIKIFIIGAISAITAFVTFMLFGSTSFRGERFLAWLDPFKYSQGKGYQIIQSLYAIASGGLFGAGLGQSRQKLGFVPEPQNDIIFSVICEELGFFGAVIILTLFAVIIWRGINIAINSPDLFGCLVASGIVIMIASQAIINISVVTNTIPNTGVPLPFISSGGTSIIIFMTLVGILLNISRYSKEI